MGTPKMLSHCNAKLLTVLNVSDVVYLCILFRINYLSLTKRVVSVGVPKGVAP